MVGKLQCDSLTNQLLDYFMDEHNEATMKGPQYVFYLHIVLKNFDEATKVASLIASQEQVKFVELGLFFKTIRTYNVDLFASNYKEYSILTKHKIVISIFRFYILWYLKSLEYLNVS